MLQAGFCSSYSCRDTQTSSKERSGKRLHRGLAHSLSEVMFNALFACKTISSLLTAVLTKISSEDRCSQDHHLRSANPKNCPKSTRLLSLVRGWGLGSRLCVGRGGGGGGGGGGEVCFLL